MVASLSLYRRRIKSAISVCYFFSPVFWSYVDVRLCWNTWTFMKNSIWWHFFCLPFILWTNCSEKKNILYTYTFSWTAEWEKMPFTLLYTQHHICWHFTEYKCKHINMQQSTNVTVHFVQYFDGWSLFWSRYVFILFE